MFKAQISSILAFLTISLSCIYSYASTNPSPAHKQVTPGSWGYPGDSITCSGNISNPSPWWKHFNDTTLDSAIQMALDNNYNIAMAVKRIDIARASVAAARAAYYPQISISAGWENNRTSGLTTSHSGDAQRMSAFNAAADMSWEIDIFGKITAQVKERKANVRISAAEAEGVRLSIAAEVANTYFNLRVRQNSLEVAKEHAKSQLAVLHIAEARFEAGIASKLDVAQAKTVYYSTVASIPMLENAIYTNINALSILLGIDRDLAFRFLGTTKRLPDYTHIISNTVPANLLQRRPDIVEAQAQIDAQAQAIGIARKEYLPSLSIDGSIGTQAHNIGDMFSAQSFTYSIAPTISWTVFDGLSRKYNLSSAKKQLEIAVDNYNLTVLSAYSETDNAIASYRNSLTYIASLETVVDFSHEAETLSIEKYKGGIAPFINVANAQLSYLENRSSLIAAQGKALSALVNIYKAIAGDIVSIDACN